jgi:hypothetical protein
MVKRGCESTEVHTLKIYFYNNNCEDSFERRDSLQRYHNHPPTKCPSITRSVRARAENKRRENQNTHDESMVMLKGFLRTVRRSG